MIIHYFEAISHIFCDFYLFFLAMMLRKQLLKEIVVLFSHLDQTKFSLFTNHYQILHTITLVVSYHISDFLRNFL